MYLHYIYKLFSQQKNHKVNDDDDDNGDYTSYRAIILF